MIIFSSQCFWGLNQKLCSIELLLNQRIIMNYFNQILLLEKQGSNKKEQKNSYKNNRSCNHSSKVFFWEIECLFLFFISSKFISIGVLDFFYFFFDKRFSLNNSSHTHLLQINYLIQNRELACKYKRKSIRIYFSL